MKWLAPQWAFAFLFAFVPVLIHLWKKTSAKKVVLGSLYLLHRKDPNFHKNLKLHQILLLITRTLLLLLVVCYFLKTISKHPSLSFLAKYYPYHQKTHVFLDTKWDSKKSLIKSFSKKFPKIKSPKFEQITSNELFSKLLDKDKKYYFLSRFYGSKEKKLNQLTKKSIQLIPVGKSSLKNTQLNQLIIEPNNPFIGEFITISSSLISNQKNKAHKVALKLESKKVRTLTLSSQSPKQNFSFKIKAQGDSFLIGKIKLEKDDYNNDNQREFKIPLKKRLKIALIEDLKNIQEKKSKLHYIYKFLNSIQQNSPQFNIDFQVMTSSQWNNSSINNFDWLILGDLQNKVWKKQSEKVIAFAQRGEIQKFYNEKFSLKSFNFDTSPINIKVLNSSILDKSLLTKQLKVYHHLQIKMTKGKAIIKSHNEVLAINYKQDYFFSFAFTKSGFSGALHPYFPVYLYRILFERWNKPHLKSTKDNFHFSRNQNYFNQQKISIKLNQKTDFSIPILILVLLLLSLEIYFILSIEKQAI
ncbi:MAG: hypothetical protein COB02_02165 [Candidatus Cloacimonadota bacterium]|nr:MAG: hypothetical protein COB02_02165 [Candidatus Cloacimonadota bacterium]